LVVWLLQAVFELLQQRREVRNLEQEISLIFRRINRISAEIDDRLGGGDELQDAGDETNGADGIHEVVDKAQEL
jgi:hypothetical protein